MTLEELRSRRGRLMVELAELGDTAGDRERASNLQRGIAAVDAKIVDVEARTARLLAAASDPNRAIPPGGSLPGWSSTTRKPAAPILAGRESREQMRSHALRCLDDQAHLLDAKAGDRLAEVIERDETGAEGLYLRAVSDLAYGTAFGKLLRNPTLAAAMMTDEERHAVQVASDAERYRGSLWGGGFSAGPLTDSSGTLPLPITVDPTITLTSPGVESPIRDLADVRTITTFEYKAATSASVTAHFAAEGTEVSDDTPIVAPLTIVPQRAQAFCTFSIEASMDYTTLQAELGQMFADAKATLEAEKFISGAGETSDEPEGLLTGGTVTLTTAGTALVAVADLEAVQEAVSPRWQQNAVWLGNLTTRNAIDQLVAQADPSHARIVDDQGNVLRRPYHETSDLPSIASAAKPIIYGDLRSAYRIVDRIGMGIELVPHVLGTNHRPLGVRGLYAFWRVSAKVVNPQAIRVLTAR